MAAPPHLAAETMREFGLTTAGLNALADWLLACGVNAVALESTGVYCSLYKVLEQRGLKVWLVDARQMKYVPGRKSDVQGCLLSYSLELNPDELANCRSYASRHQARADAYEAVTCQSHCPPLAQRATSARADSQLLPT